MTTTIRHATSYTTYKLLKLYHSRATEWDTSSDVTDFMRRELEDQARIGCTLYDLIKRDSQLPGIQIASVADLCDAWEDWLKFSESLVRSAGRFKGPIEGLDTLRGRIELVKAAGPHFDRMRESAEDYQAGRCKPMEKAMGEIQEKRQETGSITREWVASLPGAMKLYSNSSVYFRTKFGLYLIVKFASPEPDAVIESITLNGASMTIPAIREDMLVMFDMLHVKDEE